MANKIISHLLGTEIGTSISQRSISLWIMDGASLEDISLLLKIPWVNIWNIGEPSVDVADIQLRVDPQRKPIVVDSSAANVSIFSISKYVRIFQVSSTSTAVSSQLKILQRQNLKSLASDAVGTIVFVGPLSAAINDITLVRELAPHTSLLYLSGGSPINNVVPDQVYLWQETLASFVERCGELIRTPSDVSTVSLKGAPNMALDKDLLEEVERNWTFFTDNDLSGSGAVTQSSFDNFLSGEFEMASFVAGAALERTVEISKIGRRKGQSERAPLSTIIAPHIAELEKQVDLGGDLFRQVHLFCEGASGTTTLLRQTAIGLAQRGYPVLISAPLTRSLSSKTVVQFIIHVQDTWRKHIQSSTIPFIVFVDKDVDDASELRTFVRDMSNLNRSVILIRAFERSRDELGEASNAAFLRSDVSEAEMLQIGAHLRGFCAHNGLMPIPGDGEWQAFHAGLKYISFYKGNPGRKKGTGRPTGGEDVPYLFLVAIHPFISERISNINGLQQYYYKKWESLGDPELKELVEIIAAAGVYNISIPYECLRRSRTIDFWSIDSAPKQGRRTLDLFLHWHSEGPSTASWYLRIRHPVIGLLLSQLLNPLEGEAPYKALVPLLKQLAEKEDDVWLAEELVVRVARQFKRHAKSFSIETDTPVQRAARAIFAAIPDFIKADSRIIEHHEARYHMHVIHACIDALDNPDTSTLSRAQVEDILADEYKIARTLLDRALAIRNSTEIESNIYNTYALLLFNLSKTEKTKSGVDEKFLEGINLQEKAIIFDPVDALARYQYVQQILDNTPNSVQREDDKIALYGRAELRLQELISLHQSRRLRNMDVADTELQIGVLVEKFRGILDGSPALKGQTFSTFKVRDPQTALLLQIRYLLASRSLRDGFADSQTARELSAYREEMARIGTKTVRTLNYLYRLYVEDPVGRLKFDERLAILIEMKRRSIDEFIPYWHDEGALLCQLDNIPGGRVRLRELKSFRINSSAQWIWTNERVLLTNDGRGAPREFTFTVSNQDGGFAEFQFISEPIRFQPIHFPNLQHKQVFNAYVRITLDGLIASPKRLIMADLDAMGLGHNA